MLIGIGHYFPTSPILVVTDSWFGDQSLWRQVRKVLGDCFHILSRLRCNNVLFAQPEAQGPGQRGRRRKFVGVFMMGYRIRI
ncbi:transposase [Methylobacter sp. S3L5C]|uniref:transposase n=1 Tax=Methylobacter sp. S3L5C TaxID=2839024 RepID=UPI001FAD921E|nr:transposase [Methylobacter sp. S3L5C]UOA08649.1 transposase [Methylobacter sp. S3L5C]